MRIVFIFVSLILCQKVLAIKLQQGQDSLVYETTFVISSIPASTPHDASIFISGSFCDWYPDIASNKLTKNEKGEYQITLRHHHHSFDYKFTRGSWKSVEGRSNGRARPNRTFVLSQARETISIKIDSWEDISLGSYNIYMYVLFIAALQGILLIVAINSLGNKNKKANGILSALLFLITIALLGRASTFDPDIFNWQPKLILIPEIILFTYGPLFYFYIHKLLHLDIPGKKFFLINFIPVVVQMAIYLPYIVLTDQTFIYRILDQNLQPIFAWTGVAALLFSTVYWTLSRKVIQDFKDHGNLNESQKKLIGFLNGVISIKAVYLVLWLSAILVFAAGQLFDIQTLTIAEKIIDVLWLLFSFIIFALGYFAIKHPEVLREKERYKHQAIDEDEVSIVKTKLEELINIKKIYLNPDLTLNDLANEIHTSSHTLSRIINEQYGQTFGGLINHYRVREFLEKARDAENSSYLGLAFDAGFNSKTTFNRAFKKEFNTTPREYFKKMKSA